MTSPQIKLRKRPFLPEIIWYLVGSASPAIHLTMTGKCFIQSRKRVFFVNNGEEKTFLKFMSGKTGFTKVFSIQRIAPSKKRFKQKKFFDKWYIYISKELSVFLLADVHEIWAWAKGGMPWLVIKIMKLIKILGLHGHWMYSSILMNFWLRQRIRFQLLHGTNLCETDFVVAEPVLGNQLIN